MEAGFLNRLQLNGALMQMSAQGGRLTVWDVPAASPRETEETEVKLVVPKKVMVAAVDCPQLDRPAGRALRVAQHGGVDSRHLRGQVERGRGFDHRVLAAVETRPNLDGSDRAGSLSDKRQAVVRASPT